MLKMEANQINVFISSMENLMTTMFSADAKRGNLRLCNGTISPAEFVITLDIVGTNSKLSVLLPQSTAAKAGSAMMGMDMTEDDPSLEEVISEIGNMLAGNSKPELKAIMGDGIDIKIGNISKGSIPPSPGNKWIEVPFETSLGNFRILATVG